MGKALFERAYVDSVVKELGITDLNRATIGQCANLAARLEQLSGVKFIRMDQGVPGLAASQVGIAAEAEALKTGIGAIYPPADGIAPLKEESSRFIKAFLDVEVSPKGCIPVTGSVTGSFGAFIICNQLDEQKDTILFIDPGFPIQKSQLNVLGHKYDSFDIYNYRGEKLREKLESYLKKGNIAGIVYSNPNNPAWFCLTEEELKIIGELATQYDTIILEDLAYFCMDFRKELGKPFEPPFQSTVARYTDNYMLFLSGSKIFSYAGQRIAVTAVSDKLFDRIYPALAERYGGTGHFGSTFIADILYMITSGCTHAVQYALTAMYKAASDGKLDFVAETREYERRAARMKDIFRKNGFHVVYDKDVDEQVGDGFFFTIGYGSMQSGELIRELMCYGVSSISLVTTGSEQHGIRACASRMTEPQFAVLDERLSAFRSDHPNC